MANYNNTGLGGFTGALHSWQRSSQQALPQRAVAQHPVYVLPQQAVRQQPVYAFPQQIFGQHPLYPLCQQTVPQQTLPQQACPEHFVQYAALSQPAAYLQPHPQVTFVPSNTGHNVATIYGAAHNPYMASSNMDAFNARFAQSHGNISYQHGNHEVLGASLPLSRLSADYCLNFHVNNGLVTGTPMDSFRVGLSRSPSTFSQPHNHFYQAQPFGASDGSPLARRNAAPHFTVRERDKRPLRYQADLSLPTLSEQSPSYFKNAAHRANSVAPGDVDTEHLPDQALFQPEVFAQESHPGVLHAVLKDDNTKWIESYPGALATLTTVNPGLFRMPRGVGLL